MTDAELRTLLSDRFAAVRGQIADACRKAGREPTGVTLVAVTKTVSPRVAQVAADLGAGDLGESRPQELWKKAEALPGVRWHLIGHLQRNKIDRTIPLVTLIHSVDSERVLEALDTFGRKHGNPVPLLLEVNCSREENKGGFRPEDLPVLGDRLAGLTGVSVRGLMTMAAYFDDSQLCRRTFVELRELRDRLRSATGLPLPDLSMGMSNDYAVAVEEGATLVRVGTVLFESLGDPTT
jgi:pyridoxal phosphate enzyme (YggS family)